MTGGGPARSQRMMVGSHLESHSGAYGPERGRSAVAGRGELGELDAESRCGVTSVND